MTEPATTPRSRAWWKYLLVAAGAGLLGVAAGVWYLTTDSFQDLVRRRMVAEVERITGGRVEIGSIHTIPFRLQVDVREITVHGREAATEIPLAHADRLVARLKVDSLLRSEFGFHELTLDHPVIHVSFFPDGKSNIPGPSVARASDVSSVEQLFALSIDSLYLRHGELLWDDKNLPLDVAADDAALQMEYSFLRGRYESRLLLGKVDTKFDGLRTIAWMTDMKFALAPTFAEIESMRLNSGRSHIQVGGIITDFRHPAASFTYDAHLDLAEVAAVARRQDLREGLVEFKGQGKWSVEQFSAAGAMELKDFVWQDNQISLKKASLASDYTVTDDQIKFSKLQGRLLGGGYSGDAQFDNWLHSAAVESGGRRTTKISTGKNRRRIERTGPEVGIITAGKPPKGPKEKLPGVQAGAVHLRVRDLSAVEIAASLKSDTRFLRDFRPAGLASGTVDVAWLGSPEAAKIEFKVEMSPPSELKASEIPLTVHARGSYRRADEELEISQFNLSTPASRVQASGTLSQSSSLHFSVSTSDFEQWRPLVMAITERPLPFHVDGNVSLTGSIGGSFSSPAVTATLLAQDFEVTLPATAPSPQLQVPWDSLSAGLQFSSQALIVHEGSLRRDDTTATFDGNVTLQDGEFTPDSPFTAHVALDGVDVAATQKLIGYDYPINGKADVELQLSGTKSNPRAQGSIHARNVSAWEQSIASFNADVQLADGETALTNIQLQHEDSEIQGSAAYKPSQRSFRLDLTGKNFDLASIPWIQPPGLLMEGRSDFALQATGTKENPNISGQVHVRGLTFDHELAGGVDLNLATKDGELRLTGHTQFARGSVEIAGGVRLRGSYPAALSFHMDQVDGDALWRAYLRGQLTGHSAATGDLVIQGPLFHAHEWTMNGNLSNVALEVQYAKLQNAEAVHFSFAKQTLHLEQLHLTGDGTDVSAQGYVQFADPERLDLAVNGKVDLKLLNRLDGDFTGSGLLAMDMIVGGTIIDPVPQGHLQLSNGAVAYSGLPSGLSELNGSLVFTRDSLHIEKMTARTGGGSIDFKGDATHYHQQINFDVTATGKDVRLRYPPGVSSTANAELRWVGTPASSTVSGEIMVNKLAVTPNFDFSSYLESSRRNAALAPANSRLYGVKLDVRVQTAPELQMKTAVARLSGDADLRLRGSVARPAVLGRADILEGDATFNGTKFRLERGDITFANPVAIEPQVNLEASTHVRNYDLDITVTGTPERLAVNYRSEPPLPKSDIIALLALGRTSQESEQLQEQSGQTVFNDEASALIINQAMNATVSSRIQKLFGVSRIKIDPQGLTTETNPTARGPQVTIEQQFANNVSLTYSTNVSQSNQQIIQGEYYFTQNVSAVGTRDQNGVVSFDIRVRRRK